jgi:hypothetical protein
MKVTEELAKKLYGRNIVATLNNGDIVKGIWDDHISEIDNEPEGESVLIKNQNGSLIELYTADISKMVAANA